MTQMVLPMEFLAQHHVKHQAQWCTPVISVLSRWREFDLCDFLPGLSSWAMSSVMDLVSKNKVENDWASTCREYMYIYTPPHISPVSYPSWSLSFSSSIIYKRKYPYPCWREGCGRPGRISGPLQHIQVLFREGLQFIIIKQLISLSVTHMIAKDANSDDLWGLHNHWQNIYHFLFYSRQHVVLGAFFFVLILIFLCLRN